MKGFFDRLRERLNRFMTGRYGADHLGLCIIIISFVFGLIAALTGWLILTLLAYGLLGWEAFRFLSKKLSARRAENDRFLTFWWPIRTGIKDFFSKEKRDKSYKYFCCPSCHEQLRVPKGKGRIRITCPRCGQRFEKKT